MNGGPSRRIMANESKFNSRPSTTEVFGWKMDLGVGLQARADAFSVMTSRWRNMYGVD